MNRRFQRNPSAFSMLTIIALTLVVAITIVSTGAFLIPFIRSNARDAMTELQARAIAESSINFALALLNDPVTRPDIDVSTVPLQDDCREMTIQASDLNLPAQIAANVKGIRLFVRNDTPPKPSGSIQGNIFPLSYDPMLVSAPLGKFGTTNYWRTFTVLVEYGGELNRESYKFGAKVVVKPGFKTASDGGSGTSSFFTSALGARDSVTMGEGSSTTSSGASSTPDGSIKAVGDINLNADVTIDGKIQGTSGSNNIKIPKLAHPRLSNVIEFTEGQPPSIYEGGNLMPPLSIGPQDISPLLPFSHLATPGIDTVIPASDLSIREMPPALSPSATTPNFASIADNPGEDAYTINSAQLEHADLSVLNSISTPTKLFLKNTGDINTPLEITSDIGSSSAAGKLQLWYNGERPLLFKGDSIKLLVYAPFANITIGDGTKTTNFSGAIVGNNVAVAKNSNVTFENSTSNNSFANSYLNFKPTDGTAPNTIKWQIQSFKELRYDEFLAESKLTPRKS